MISNVKFNELAKRVELLEGDLFLVEAMARRIEMLEENVMSLVQSQGGEIPPGMTVLATLAAEFGISTKKAEELAHNTGVLMVKHKASYIVNEGRFREAARLVLRSAKRKYGSAYWFHPLLGKFQMSGGIPK